MNVLVISNYSGAINPMRPEAEIFLGLKKLGVQITIMTPNKGAFVDHFKEAGIEIIDYHPEGKFDRKAIKLIRKTVKERSIDIVHAFNSKAISTSIWALQGSTTKLVTYRGYTGNISWYDPSCYLTHLHPRVDYIVCLAESVREMFLKNGVSKHKPVTINKGHKAEWYDSIPAADLSEFNFPQGAMVCSFVANNRTKMKGVKYLIEAANALPDDANISFLMIGEGIDSDEMKALIAQGKHRDKFVFSGFRNDASALVKSCDISISVSLFGEATQKAMIEAMYLGNPVIISDISGNRGMIKKDEGGYIVPTKDSKAITKALMKFYSNRDEIPAMGLAAKKHITEFLSSDRSVKEYKEFYERITPIKKER
jgi:glycosyltransferase involved in cell wall biosynthesis